MLYAPFVAGVQIILYVGGIMVLFLFVIMLVNLERSEKEKQFNQQWTAGILARCRLGGLVRGDLHQRERHLSRSRSLTLPEAVKHAASRTVLYSNYMFAFEIASLLLLVAIIGAVVMAKKRI